jgi:hypothetical protein
VRAVFTLSLRILTLSHNHIYQKSIKETKS